MDNGIALKNPNAVIAGDGFGARLAALPPKSRLALGLGLASLVGVVLARIIVEFYGGSLLISGENQPGFVVRLPAAA